MVDDAARFRELDLGQPLDEVKRPGPVLAPEVVYPPVSPPPDFLKLQEALMRSNPRPEWSRDQWNDATEPLWNDRFRHYRSPFVEPGKFYCLGNLLVTV